MKHPAQESDRIPGKRLGLVAIGLIVASTVGVLVAWGLGAGSLAAGARSHDVVRDPSDMENTPFSVEAQGLDQRRRAEAYLASYGWVDRDHGVVHVPVDVAVELYLARRGKAPVSAQAGGAP